MVCFVSALPFLDGVVTSPQAKAFDKSRARIVAVKPRPSKQGIQVSRSLRRANCMTLEVQVS